MWEVEDLEDGTREEGLRGTNLVSLQGKSGIVSVSLVGFFQPLMTDWGDHRVAVEASAGVPLGSMWMLDVSVRGRRDSRPPAEVEPNDIGLSVGLKFSVN
jgi:hypothetical protein